MYSSNTFTSSSASLNKNAIRNLFARVCVCVSTLDSKTNVAKCVKTRSSPDVCAANQSAFANRSRPALGCHWMRYTHTHGHGHSKYTK